MTEVPRSLKRVGAWLFIAVALVTASSAIAAPRIKAATEMDPADPSYFLPANLFDGKGNRLGVAPGVPVAVPMSAQPLALEAIKKTEVLIYQSSATRNYFERGGVRSDLNVVLWQRFLARYKFPYRIIRDLKDPALVAGNVLVLPSDVALSDVERLQIRGFATKGGSIIATWMLGTRDPEGKWVGFDFMESLLSVRVTGFTGLVDDERYIHPYGDTPVTHSIPAGSRMWTDLLPAWSPLMVRTATPAAGMRTWGHRPTRESGSDVMAYSANGRSRVVYFGWPERTWMSADARYHDGLLYDSVTWALRLPAVEVATWPYPYRSAFVSTTYMADVFNDNDIPFGKLQREKGLKGSYYVLGFEIDKSKKALTDLAAMGHEISYEGDQYQSFADQPAAQQTTRLNTMRTATAAAKIPISAHPGFNPPMDGSDATTRQVVSEQPIDYMVTWVDAVNGCVPQFQTSTAGTVPRKQPLVLIPRLLPGIEERLDEISEEEAVAEHQVLVTDLSRMGCVAVARYANQSLLSPAAQSQALDAYTRHKETMWGASGSEISQWWIERGELKPTLTGDPITPTLSVTIPEGGLKHEALVWLNLPRRQAKLSLTGPQVRTVYAEDGLRAGLLVRDLKPGNYQWQINFVGDAEK